MGEGVITCGARKHFVSWVWGLCLSALPSLAFAVKIVASLAAAVLNLCAVMSLEYLNDVPGG